MSITWKFQTNRSNDTLKSGFFGFTENLDPWSGIFFGLKPSRDQDGANKKKFSQIGPAVPEEIGHKHTNKQTSCCFIIEIDLSCRNGIGINVENKSCAEIEEVVQHELGHTFGCVHDL